MRASLGIPGDAFVVGMMARYHPFKDHALFIGSARRLLHFVPGAYFVMAGPGVDDETAELTRQLEPALRARVRLLGPRSDLPELASAFDLATLTSYTEGFPNVVGEAMACGLPFVATDAGDAASIVGKTGWCVPVRDEGALTAAWKAAAEMTEEERRDRGSEARRRIDENFALGRITAQYEDLYASAAAQQGSGSRRRSASAPANGVRP